jgi:steroid 5-alpha reductase family enzyme
MLAFGDLGWVPFVYSLQARYLLDQPTTLSPLAVCGVLALEVVGLYVFRSANSQKDTFKTNREDPSVKHLRVVKVSADGKRALLAGGWWGLARHVNYFGDWLMALAWCLPTGFGSPVPYFYAAYFAVLLVHRERRDDEKCSLKYGAKWDEYRALVPWRIIPYVY